MNLFRSINSAVNQLNSLGNYINHGSSHPHSDHVKDLIRSCTYAEEYIFSYAESNI